MCISRPLLWVSGYYECGGRWQYCEGKTCSADSSKCSVYCENDMFPYSCNHSSQCEGAYRDGYCSVDTCYEDELVAWNADRSFVDCGYPWTGGEGYCEVGFKCCCEFSISGEVCKNLSIITEQDYDYDWEIDEECESSCPSFLY